jgi:hypothetical protein
MQTNTSAHAATDVLQATPSRSVRRMPVKSRYSAKPVPTKTKLGSLAAKSAMQATIATTKTPQTKSNAQLASIARQAP